MTQSLFFSWHTDAFNIDFSKNPQGAICLLRLWPAGCKPPKSASALFQSSELPLVSVRLTGKGNTADKTAKCLVGGYLSAGLKYESHQERRDRDVQTLSILSKDQDTGIAVTTCLIVYGIIPVLRSTITITNESKTSNVTVKQLSLTIGGLTTLSKRWYEDYVLMTATNGWFREAQWREHSLPDIGLDDYRICELVDGHSGSQATFGLQNRGSFSSGSHLPMGVLKSRAAADTWVWQIEHNGSWRWEIGDYKDSVYLAAGGPTGVDHDWKQVLLPGQSFTSVPTAVSRVNGGVEAVMAALTDYRRKIMRLHQDNVDLPIVFNDYMNCLMGDPDEEKIKALLDPVVQAGAEFFVIDAGWYAEDSNWWDDVGLWEPSTKRFPSGFKALLDEIKRKGLTPGLWLEPEVVGIRSVVGDRLPTEAFFQECGQRIVERGRFQLDYRHPHVREHMDRIIKTLVDYGVGFFKFDYNIEVIQGTDVAGSSSTGSAHLEHQRAYLAWVESLLDKYPGLVIENCSSGAQRMEYAMLSVHSLQSTSDQQDPALYAAISAALPTAVVPEQSGSWAYPQPEWSDELNALTVVNSLLGRVYLSGRLDRLSSHQMELIVEGMQVYKAIRHNLAQTHAIWPLGLPRGSDQAVLELEGGALE
ncbi:hypothetical protein CDV36_013381 [Fusarium kuroshium]|uniref:alpha-galactosidase n=1 Tax=Fusarium kuroshium TaxID=2010991 RepID=A0A3M2RNY2_9HYPO|nr:hypothetical protein CDV36_013381 [Fusarium kuroshium]